VDSDVILSWFRKRRRARVRARPLPLAWIEIIERNVPYYRLLPEEDRKELRGHIQVFLDEKQFEGCAGMIVTDEIRVTIAAQACILLLHRETECYPLLDAVLVYPREYGARTTRYHGSYIREDTVEVRSGESWYRGTVVLSWNDVMDAGADPGNPWNVVLHEFAHQLDDETGAADGTPRLAESSQYPEWTQVVGGEYEQLVRVAGANAASFLDPYGAESPAEFFAVVTEYFFEAPLDLRHRHPQLYEQFRRFYRQDPAELLEAARTD
jgi:Mlc titration factor MtfA (ptsG expression regulator)